jgi:hypothetical protein
MDTENTDLKKRTRKMPIKGIGRKEQENADLFFRDSISNLLEQVSGFFRRRIHPMLLGFFEIQSL